MENPIKLYDLGVPLFLETPIYFYRNIVIDGEANEQSLRANWRCFGVLGLEPETFYIRLL